jgi:hypothetical protein
LWFQKTKQSRFLLCGPLCSVARKTKRTQKWMTLSFAACGCFLQNKAKLNIFLIKNDENDKSIFNLISLTKNVIFHPETPDFWIY